MTFVRRVGSMVQGEPFAHARFPWIAVYPWRCASCKRVTITRTTFLAEPGLCPACNPQSQAGVDTATSADERALLRAIAAADGRFVAPTGAFSPTLDLCRHLEGRGLLERLPKSLRSYALTEAGRRALREAP